VFIVAFVTAVMKTYFHKGVFSSCQCHFTDCKARPGDKDPETTETVLVKHSFDSTFWLDSIHLNYRPTLDLYPRLLYIPAILNTGDYSRPNQATNLAKNETDPDYTGADALLHSRPNYLSVHTRNMR